MNTVFNFRLFKLHESFASHFDFKLKFSITTKDQIEIFLHLANVSVEINESESQDEKGNLCKI